MGCLHELAFGDKLYAITARAYHILCFDGAWTLVLRHCGHPQHGLQLRGFPHTASRQGGRNTVKMAWFR